MFVTGMTGIGKSTLLRGIFLSVPEPRLVVDPVGSALTAVPGAVTWRDPDRWPSGGTLRFVPSDPADLAVYDRLYLAARRRIEEAWRSGDHAGARLWVWCDEAGLVMPANQAPRAAVTAVIAGRKWPLGHAACHTRPRHCDRNLISQAQHLIVGALPLEEDRRYLAGCAGVPIEWLTPARYGAEMVWWDVRRNVLTPLRLRR